MFTLHHQILAGFNGLIACYFIEIQHPFRVLNNSKTQVDKKLFDELFDVYPRGEIASFSVKEIAIAFSAESNQLVFKRLNNRLPCLFTKF